VAQKGRLSEQLDKYKDKVVGSITILKKGDKEMLSKLSQEDTLTMKSHPPPLKQYTKVIQETIDLKEEDYKQGEFVLMWDKGKASLIHARSLINFG
jgi:hypothetical protein